MAYQVKRKSRIKERLELCDESGAVVLPVDVEINIDDMAGRITAAQQTLGMAQELINREPQSEKAQEAFGSAVIALFSVIFGKKNTDKILAFYSGRYTEMLVDVFPFINDCIMPKIKEASAARRQQLLDAANAARAAKRKTLLSFFRQ